MGIGKYFHRDKNDSPNASKSRSRATSLGTNDPGFQSSRYEAMPPAGLPQTGTYPIKGNNSTTPVAQNSSYRKSMDDRPHHSTRPETAPTHRATTTTTTTTVTSSAPRIETPRMNNNFHFFDQDQMGGPARGDYSDARRLQQDSTLEQDFSGMKLGHDASNATPPPIPYYPGSGSGSSRIDPRVDSAPRNDPSSRKINQGSQQPYSPFYGGQGSNVQQQYSSIYNNQHTSEGYGQGHRSPISKSRSNGDFNPGYNQTSTTPTTNKRASGSYDLGYGQATRSPVSNPRASGDFNDVDETKMGRRSSIPRKQVATAGYNSTSPVRTSYPATTDYPGQTSSEPPPPVPKHDSHPRDLSSHHNSQSAPQQNLPAQRSNNYDARTSPRHKDYNQQQQYRDPSAVPQGLNYGPKATNQRNIPSPSAAPPLFPRAQPNSGAAAKPAAQDIVARAQTNTKDTDIVERIAPAVVQETVVEKVHHKREEVITRDIHTHDVYHRILPIIDVEVLPPRHFLPVEGGGLVEIGADEVPGRAKNWVIAETASKIPSDQPAPKGVSRFTAREFPGTEGDKIEYTTPDGIRRTEETWVHPPELETGARDSGQTWPMVFTKEGKDARVRTSKDGKRREKRRSSAGAAAAARQ